MNDDLLFERKKGQDLLVTLMPIISKHSQSTDDKKSWKKCVFPKNCVITFTQKKLFLFIGHSHLYT